MEPLEVTGMEPLEVTGMEPLEVTTGMEPLPCGSRGSELAERGGPLVKVAAGAGQGGRL